jgi:4-hydroxybenzoate polyprenyltransferase
MSADVERVELPKTAGRPSASLGDYLAIARFDHWVKHVFVLPGLALAWLLGGDGRAAFDPIVVLLGLLAAGLASSANYVINEYLDAPFDAFHPTKRERSSVVRAMSRGWVGVEYALFAGAAAGLAFALSRPLGWVVVAFLVSGLVYNVRPLRTKDLVFWDVATEAVNNPIRLMIGWLLVDPSTLPPSSLLLAYWAGGAFLMSTKRLTEYRTIVGAGLTARVATGTATRSAATATSGCCCSRSPTPS